MAPKSYRVVSPEIQAMQWDGDADYEKWGWVVDSEAAGWCIAEDAVTHKFSVYNKLDDQWIPIEVGDWIIRDAGGAFHPYKPNLFGAIYEVVN